MTNSLVNPSERNDAVKKSHLSQYGANLMNN